ncbi:MAG: type II CAAX prenyl endopeptidase Rce1 family protein [Microcystaceae cyanobacterium]
MLKKIGSTIYAYPAPLRLGIFILGLICAWLPIALPLFLLIREDTNLRSIVTMVPLGLLFFIGLYTWGKIVYPAQNVWRLYGLGRPRQNGVLLLKGLAWGLLFTFSLFITESLLGWVEIDASGVNLGRIILEGSLTGLGVAFAEECFFRGWLLTELERDYTLSTALWTNSILFATLHFLKPLPEIIRTFPQFPALILLGILLVIAKRSYGQLLGICIGLHGGLVWGYYILNVGQLLHYTNRVPDWVTGIDQNPLAGILGIIFLGLLMGLIRVFAPQKPR